jgi:hypothetical protein
MEGRGADEREVLTDVAKPDKLKVGSVVRIVDEPFGVRFGTCTAIKSSGVTVLIWLLGRFRVQPAPAATCPEALVRRGGI